MARRAYAAEDKDVRRQVILKVAGDLFLSGAGDLPAVAEVAVAAGLAKGTVYLYFPTKGAIFAAILQDGWGEVLDHMEHTFRAAGGERSDKVSAFLASYVTYVEQHPELLQLDALGHAVLERNMGPDILLAFKQGLLRRLTAGGAVLENALALPAGRGIKLLERTYAMTRGLWQSFDLPRSGTESTFVSAQTNFRGELLEALTEYWTGALAGLPGP